MQNTSNFIDNSKSLDLICMVSIAVDFFPNRCTVCLKTLKVSTNILVDVQEKLQLARLVCD